MEECSRGAAPAFRRGWKGCRRYRSGSAHGQMGIDHGNDMACGTERPGLAPVLPGKVFDDSVRYPTCNLGENGHCMPCRCHGLSYGCLVAAIKMSMTPFFQLRRQVMGRL